MTKQDLQALLVTQAACMQVEAMGMQAENQICVQQQRPLQFHGFHFDELITKYGLDYNSVVKQLTDAS